MKKEVTILIVTHNAFPFLKCSINSIKKAKTDIPYKILVIDNGSDSSIETFLKSEEIFFIKNKKNIGYIEAQAQAFKMIDTPYLCSCNEDIVVTNMWLDKLLAKIKSNPKIKIVAPIKWGSRNKHPYNKLNSRKVWENIKSNSPNIYLKPISALNEFTYGKSLEKFADDFKNVNHLRDSFIESPPDFVPGFCFLTEKKIWNIIDGFVDLEMKKYGTEDIERCWRLGLNKYKIMKTSDVYIHHFEGASISKNNINTEMFLLRNNRILLKKYGKYFWNWLTNEMENKSLTEIMKEHWIIEKLLTNCKKQDIPDKIILDWNKYAKNNI